MTKKINNWKPVVKSILNIAAEHGLTVETVNDGEEMFSTENIKEAVEIVCSVDEASVYFADPNGKRVWCFIVLGNEPCETICDHTVNPFMEKAADQFSEKWEGKNVPTKIITR